MGTSLFVRPDGRRFLSLREIEAHEYPAAISAALASGGPLYIHADLANDSLVAACADAGFATETVSRRYDVPFSGIARGLPRALAKSKIEIVQADEIDSDSLFRLDELLRNDVPGLAGWVGDRAMFDHELASDDFDATGYLVAQDATSGELGGLIRFWRDQAGPKLGLLGVLHQHRRGFLAHRLLHAATASASQWGSPTFSTQTARLGLQRRLERLGGVCSGTFAQLVHHG